MSIRVMTQVWYSAPYEGGTLLVLLALADWAHDDGTHIFPTIKTLGLKARLAERQTQKCLRILEADEVIERFETRGKRTEWRINLKRLMEFDVVTDTIRSCSSDAQNAGGTKCGGDSGVVRGVHSEARGVHSAAPHIDNRYSEPSKEPLLSKSSESARSQEVLTGAESAPATIGVSDSRKPQGAGLFPPDFEAFYAAYPHPKNASKPMSFQAWTAVEKFRPELPVLLRCVSAYESFIAEQNAQRRKSDPHRVCHAGNWLREFRWQTFIEKVEQQLSDEPDTNARARIVKMWNGLGARLLKELTPALIDTWFCGSVLEIDGGKAILRVPRRLNRDRIATNYAAMLERVLEVDSLRIELMPQQQERTA